MDSIILNIAEGSERYSNTDFSRFLNNSLTSVNEVVACLDCALDDGYLIKEEHNNYLSKAENLARQLKAFSSKVRRDNRRIQKLKNEGTEEPMFICSYVHQFFSL